MEYQYKGTKNDWQTDTFPQPFDVPTLDQHKQMKGDWSDYLSLQSWAGRYLNGMKRNDKIVNLELNTGTGSFKLFKRPFPGFLTILTL